MKNKRQIHLLALQKNKNLPPSTFFQVNSWILQTWWAVPPAL